MANSTVLGPTPGTLAFRNCALERADVLSRFSRYSKRAHPFDAFVLR